MEYEELFEILKAYTGKTKEELKALPPEEFARQVINYVNTLEQDTKDRFLEEFYEHSQIIKKNKEIAKPDADFAKEFPKKIKIENGQYKIYEDLDIEKDIAFPKGIYNICPGQCIRANDCSITILPGTKFLLNNNTHIKFKGGQFIAMGNEKEKIEFAPAGKIMSARICLENIIDARLEHVTIKDLNHSYNCFEASNSDLWIIFSEIRNNKNYFNIKGGEAVIENTIFIGNKTKSNGGGILIDDGANVKLKRCRIENNKAEEGGGIYIEESSKVSIDDCDIENNKAKIGGGICVDDGNVKITNTRIKGNAAEEERGGGIEADDSKITLDDRCIIEGNSEPQINGEDIKYNSSIIKDKKSQRKTK